MNKRLDPANDIKINRTFVNMGDKASTLIFDDMGEGYFSVGQGDKSEAHTLLKAIANTNDGNVNWDEANNGDGGHRLQIELWEGGDKSKAADDFVALVEAAIAGESGLKLNIDAFDKITIEAPGSWSTDHLVFEGDWVTDALMNADTGFDLYNNKDQIKVFDFDDPDRDESICTGRTDNLDQSEGAVGAILNGSFLDEVNSAKGVKSPELQNLVFAALDEKYGLGETKDLGYVTDDGEQIIVEVTNQHWRGPATDAMILTGGDVEAIMDAYTGSFRGGLDTGDGHSRMAYYDTDANTGGKGGVWFGGGKNGVTFDAAGTITLNDVTGNGLTQKENNPNRAWQDDIDEFVFNALEYSGESDVEVIAGGEAGDDFMTVEMTTNGGNTNTLILEGERIGDAIDFYVDTGGEFDFFA